MTPATDSPASDCARCLKPADLCVCDAIRPLDTRIYVLILQHPQEPDKELGTARIAHLSLPNSTLKIGLSWPNLRSALGREAVPAKWAVLYLGSGIKSPAGQPTSQPNGSLTFVSKGGQVLPNQDEIRAQLEGLVVLDGTWSQAKALWWRNPWLLKLKRAILNSPRKSLYRELRREPRRECLSTIESVAEGLSALGESPELANELCKPFARLLEKRRGRRSR